MSTFSLLAQFCRVEFREDVSHDVSAGILQSVIPLRTRPDYRKMYAISEQNGGVRLGKILFDLDTLDTL